MRVKFKATGQTGTIPDDKFDPNLFESLEPIQNKSGGIADWYPLIGQILGGVGGGVIGGVPGAIAGATGGGGLGEVFHQKAEKTPTNIGAIGKEALWGGVGEVTGLGIGKLLGKAGSALTKGGVKLGEKAVKASPTEIKNMVKLTGKTPGAFGAAEGLLTRNVDDIVKAIEPINEAYSSLVSKTKIGKGELVKLFNAKAAELEKSILPTTKSKAKTLREISKNVSKKYGDTIEGEQLRQLKIDLGLEAGENRFLLGKNNAYKLAEDVTRSGLYGASGETTAPIRIGGKTVEATLPLVGKQEQALMQLKKIVERTQQLGKGSEAIGLGMLGRAGGGASLTSGLSIAAGERDPTKIALNALAGAGLGYVANNPKVLSVLVKGLTKGGDDLTRAAQAIGGAKAPLLLTLLGQGSGQAVKSLIQPGEENAPYGTDTTQPTDIQQTENYGQNQTGNGVLDQQSSVSQMGLDAETIGRAKIMDLLYNKGRNFSKLEQLEKAVGGGSTKETQTRQQIQNTVDEMKRLYGLGTGQSLSIGKGNIGLGGVLARGKTIARKQLDQNFVDRLTAYKQMATMGVGILNQARGAGTLNAGEFEVMMQNIPSEYSTEEQARQWFENVRKIVSKMPLNLQTPINVTE